MMRAYLIALPAAAIALAAAAPPAEQPASDKAPDPNQIICEKQTVVGSRLAVKRICKTRAQWAVDRLQDRQDLERVQTQRGIPSSE